MTWRKAIDRQQWEQRERTTMKKTESESAVLEAIAAIPEPQRAMGERLHAIIRASAPGL